ncbi:hypothetical protein G4D61_15865 [Bacillus ginsengihumi]|uniref:Uncharacterized protein n=1 Tax=Heyndrickxia ginsengihumi TaxID=363870 RepID=A0A6M0PBS1_9BACI|nr:hypothetical protein [Heyndrickxia ginsengihumi]NEY21420.1 hypothetical protein [Heyndrickxia ginsengihumi]
MANDVNNIANVNLEEDGRECNISNIFNPTDEQMNTIIHSLNTLNQVEILNIIGSFNISIDRDTIKKKMELIQYLIYGFKKGMFNERLFNELRSQAFNPDIDSTDGFFFSFEADVPTITKEGLETFLKDWNEVKDDKTIEFLELNNQSATFLVTKHTDKFIFDKESMFSIKYNDEKRAKVEVHFDKSIVYVQTTNTVIYNAIKTIIKEFLQELLDIEKLYITPPKMSKNLSLTFNDDFTAATEENSVHPNTIKLLDILLELDAPSSSFSGFECVNITLDHEDTINRKDAKSKIVSQNYGGGDLLKNKVVKDLILSNRIIYDIEFIIEYNHVDNEGDISKQLVTVGMINDRKSSLRIFIKNSDYNIRNVIKNAYSELTRVFISNYGQSQLRNEDNIKKLLGLS